jgi:acyl carrier protein
MPTGARLLQLAAQRFQRTLEDLSLDDDLFAVLGIDSVQALELLSDLEREFRVEVPDYELADVRTFADLVDKIEERL